MLSLLPTLALALLGAHTFKAGGKPRLRRAFWLLVAVDAAWYIPSGDRSSLAALATIVLVVRYYAFRQKLPWKTMIVTSALLVFIVFPFGIEYRGNNTTYQNQTRSALSTAFHTLAQRYKRGPGPILHSGFKSAFERFSDATSLALISEQGRNQMDLRTGETFVWAFEGFLPRALVPGKADPGLIGNRFGRAYGVVYSENEITSIAPTQVGEFYLNFGFLGFVMGMPIIGAIYRLINDYFRSRRDNPYALAIYALAAWPFVSGLETIIAIGLIGVVKTLVFLGVLMFVLGKLLAARPPWREHTRVAQASG
jgi:hypothetical protein